MIGWFCLCRHWWCQYHVWAYWRYGFGICLSITPVYVLDLTTAVYVLCLTISAFFFYVVVIFFFNFMFFLDLCDPCHLQVFIVDEKFFQNICIVVNAYSLCLYETPSAQWKFLSRLSASSLTKLKPLSKWTELQWAWALGHRLGCY